MFLALKELKHNKARFSLIIGILTLIIFLVLFLSGIAKGLSAATVSTVQNSKANYYILSDSADKLISRSSFTDDDIKNLNNSNELVKLNENATPINLFTSNFTMDSLDKKTNIVYFAIDPSAFLMPEVIDGNTLNNNKEIVLNNSFKEDGIEIGDIIKDSASDLELKVVGFTKNQMYGHMSVGVISLDTYKEIMTSATGREYNNFQALAIDMDESTENQDSLTSFVNDNLDKKVLLTKVDVIKNIPGYSAEQATILMMLVFLLIISSFIVGVFFYITTMQKLPEFGVLKALGSKMSTLASSLTSQVFMLSVISMVIGNALTFSLASMLPASMPFVLSSRDAALVSILFIVIALLSSLFSIKKIRKVDALSAIGGNY
ncbi:ABC transporter permease [Clostridium sp. AL.422]|uniref:ABC transporter permease n=1 Tax=Clostridium TaxID=1485 RepID=UPI00293DD021|nr:MULTISPECIES: ABC transporter permease [unclassified Clostridium]MDV4152616.1 ABC transporter permease [Clostridium sp. AL.422]